MSCPAPLSITDLFDPAADVLAEVSDHLYGQLLAWLLIAVGIWFTVRTRGLQFRLFGQMLRAIAGSRDSGEGISSFQAFTIGLASRVGTGNIVGVALAITLGGPGAVAGPSRQCRPHRSGFRAAKPAVVRPAVARLVRTDS